LNSYSFLSEKQNLRGEEKRRMNVTTKSFFALFMISAILMGSYLFLSVEAQDSEGSLGKDIANAFRDIVRSHQSVIEEFILDTKLTVASTHEKRLDVINSYINETLRAEINRVKQEREELIAQFKAGEIDNATLVIELKDLASDIAYVAKTMRTIGEELSELGKDLGEELKTRAEELSDDFQAVEEEATSVANEVLDALSTADVPVAQEVVDALTEAELPVEEAAENLPEEPEVPEEVPEVPEVPEDVPEEPEVPEAP
jgi:gas vesicle protein